MQDIKSYITIFFSKKTGRISTYCITEIPQNLDYFGIDRIDYELIYDFVVFEYVPELELIIKSKELYRIDPETKEIIYNNFDLYSIKQYKG